MNGLVRVVAVVALLAAGCGGEPGGSAPPPATGPTGGVPNTTTGGPTATDQPGGACPATVSVRVVAGAAARTVCLPVNGTLRLTADPGQNLGRLVSSNPKILSCTADACTPRLPGTVTVSTSSAQWELRVNVVAYGSN